MGSEDVIKASEAGRLKRRTVFMITALLILLALILLQVWYVVLQIYPEMAMAINTQCKAVSPIYGWNGKVMGVQIGQNSLLNRPDTHNIHHRRDANGDRRKLQGRATTGGYALRSLDSKLDRSTLSSPVLSTTSTQGKGESHSHRLIVWGTHHRTGTYFAQKMFATICAHYNWCCVFHPTRDSLEAIKHLLTIDDVFVMGHNQWIWNPAELLGPHVKYKFVHFYRNPVDKIISGYHYHRFGVEPWTKKVLHFTGLCNNMLYSSPTEASAIGAGDTGGTSAGAGAGAGMKVSRGDVVDYCHSIQLCETCCRKEHEVASSASATAAAASGSGSGTANPPSVRSAEYSRRAIAEYAYVCKHLGKVQRSLQDELLSAPAETGLAIEASIDYFESSLMIRLMQETWSDPDTMHLDLGSLQFDFDSQVKRILRHIQVASTEEEEAILLDKLRFLDVSKSTLYRWTMSNWLYKHVLSSPAAGAENSEYRNHLLNNAEFMGLYGHMLQVLQGLESTREGQK